MGSDFEFQEKVTCRLEMTHNARKGIGQWFVDVNDWLSLQDAYNVYIEKRPTNQHGNMSFSLYFDNESNEKLAKHLKDRVAVMECVYKNEGFLATGFRVRGRKEPVRTNRRFGTRLKFHLGNNGLVMPIQLYTRIRELPIAEERSEYVKKRIAGWEGFLRIEEKNADVADIKTTVTSSTLNDDFSKVHILCNQLTSKERKKISGFSVKVAGTSDDIGTVVNINQSKRSIEVELNRKYKDSARRQIWQLKRGQEITFSNFAELSQIRRLRKGFTDLQNGFAANANLEKILFEERPVVQISKKKVELDFHNNLNEFQQEAVKGAMTSNDLYVIQGPPGTGKTTVISEICHQNVKAGLRTLVASQSNLAVDHALSRLLSDQDVRILRFGRTESIEEEGKKFIEENVALNWKDETLVAINEQIKLHAKQQIELETELTQSQQIRQQLQSDIIVIGKQIATKNQAKEESRQYKNELEKLHQVDEDLSKKREIENKKRTKLIETLEQIKIEVLSSQNLLKLEQSKEKPDEEIVQLENKLEKLQQLSTYLTTLESIKEVQNNSRVIREKLDFIQTKRESTLTFLSGFSQMKKLEALKQYVNQSEITLPITIDLQINELSRMITLIKSEAFSYEYNEWKDVYDRLEVAVHKIEKLLQTQQYPLQSIQQRNSEKYKTISEIHEMLDQIGHYLINPKTKMLLQIQNYSVEKQAALKKIAYNLAFLYGKREEVRQRTKTIKVRVFDESKRQFSSIQLEITKHGKESLQQLEKEEERLQQDLTQQGNQLAEQEELRSRLEKQLSHPIENESFDSVQEALMKQEEAQAMYKQNKILIKKYESQLEKQMMVLENGDEKLQTLKEELKNIDETTEFFQTEISTYKKKLESLATVLDSKPEEQYKETVSNIDSLREKEQNLKDILSKLPITQAVQTQWRTLLEGATTYDLDEIRKLYVQYANVIGTTCVASARKTFVEDYPTFDVVIIDEVSKATPPELLLPMLKGKKIILVGDHHQLPPLVGQETLEELVEESANDEEKRELKKLLKESLFERLFRSLPAQNKTMLSIQYRMHENIMNTITPFYNDDTYRLQCGVLDSNRTRDHLLESRNIKREDHLVWFDMPNTLPYFEAQVKGGTSRYNEAELAKIRELIIDLDKATEQAKREGRMDINDKKSVGIISFYGEQVKRIDRLLQQEIMPKHLHYRTGSVDKFQGMEMDIIILSFVRNHAHKNGEIGFAKDYRRLNVALSRARELLIIVGSSEMFTKKTKNLASQKMYKRLLESVESQNGLKILAEERY